MGKAESSLLVTDSKAWRGPLLDTTLKVTALLGSLWLGVALLTNVALRSSPEGFVIEGLIALTWLAALKPRLHESFRLAVLLGCYLGGAAMSAIMNGPVVPAVLLLLVLFLLLATLYRGTRGGVAAGLSILLLYAIGAYGWAHGIFPPKAGPVRVDPHEPVVWLRIGIAQIFASASIVTIVKYIVSHTERVVRALTESEEKFASAFRSNPDPMAVSEVASGRFLDVNARFIEQFGWTREALVGHTSVDIGFFAHESDRHQLANEVLKTGCARDLPSTCVTKDGRSLPCLVSGEVVQIGGRACFISVVRDISVRLAAERALRESEEKFSQAFRASPDAISITEADSGRFVDVNEGYERLMGYSRSEVRGRTSLEIGIWTDPAERAPMMERLRQDGALRDYRIDGRNRAGERLILLFSSDRIELGGKPHYVSVAHDITERAQAEQALRASEERARLLIEHAPDAVVVFDLGSQRFVAANPAAEALFGLPQAELLKRSPLDLSPERQPDGSLSSEGVARHVALAAQGMRATFEWVHRSAQGRDIDCEIRLLRLPDPTRVLIRGSIFDVSERKRAERALRALSASTAAATGQAFFEASAEELARELSVRVALLAELRNEAGKQHLAILALWSDTPQTTSILDVAGSPTETLLRAESLHVADGVAARYPNDPWLAKLGAQSYLGLPIRDATGRALGVVAVLDDRPMPDSTAAKLLLATTASRAAAEIVRLQGEAQVRRLNADLERRVQARTLELTAANAELESFSYSVSHDLRSPLRAIDGFSRALEEDYGDKLDVEGKDHLSRVRAATQRMGQLIDDLLGLSRATRVEMRRETVDLVAIALDVTEELQARQPERQVDFTHPAELPALADPALTRIVLINLLDNAWKYSRARPLATVELGVLPDPNEDGASVYFVRDDGAGFDMRYANKLFVPFQRLHGRAEFEGTGIGLATVRRIVTRHGGKVWAESVVSQGTIVYFTLSGALA